MSLSTLPAQKQQEIFLEILQMSSEELSERLSERGLDDKGDEPTKQSRLLCYRDGIPV